MYSTDAEVDLRVWRFVGRGAGSYGGAIPRAITCQKSGGGWEFLLHRFHHVGEDHIGGAKSGRVGKAWRLICVVVLRVTDLWNCGQWIE